MHTLFERRFQDRSLRLRRRQHHFRLLGIEFAGEARVETGTGNVYGILMRLDILMRDRRAAAESCGLQYNCGPLPLKRMLTNTSCRSSSMQERPPAWPVHLVASFPARNRVDTPQLASKCASYRVRIVRKDNYC